jgi:hypothetical protein
MSCDLARDCTQAQLSTQTADNNVEQLTMAANDMMDVDTTGNKEDMMDVDNKQDDADTGAGTPNKAAKVGDNCGDNKKTTNFPDGYPILSQRSAADSGTGIADKDNIADTGIADKDNIAEDMGTIANTDAGNKTEDMGTIANTDADNKKEDIGTTAEGVEGDTGNADKDNIADSDTGIGETGNTVDKNSGDKGRGKASRGSADDTTGDTPAGYYFGNTPEGTESSQASDSWGDKWTGHGWVNNNPTSEDDKGHTGHNPAGDDNDVSHIGNSPTGDKGHGKGDKGHGKGDDYDVWYTEKFCPHCHKDVTLAIDSLGMAWFHK